jgi:hypothetical protein
VTSYYHASSKFFTVLKPNSWVTTLQADARFLAIPEVAEKLSYNSSGYKLSKKIIATEDLPEDCAIFIYKIKTNNVAPIESNLGQVWDWNWQTLDWNNVELVEYYPSWYKLFNVCDKNIKQNLEELFELPNAM